MLRKAAAAKETVEPRRLSRIKEQPKSALPVKKAPAKPWGKKADMEAKADKETKADAEEIPKACRGRKRKTAEEVNGEEAEAESEKEPPAKKV